MSNLTRYTIDYVPDSCDGDYVQHNVSKDGEYVKFDDVKELLNSSHNSAMVPCANESCPANWIQHGCTSFKYADCTQHQ